jgi:hypothetical protein
MLRPQRMYLILQRRALQYNSGVQRQTSVQNKGRPFGRPLLFADGRVI